MEATPPASESPVLGGVVVEREQLLEVVGDLGDSRVPKLGRRTASKPRSVDRLRVTGGRCGVAGMEVPSGTRRIGSADVLIWFNTEGT